MLCCAVATILKASPPPLPVVDAAHPPSQTVQMSSGDEDRWRARERASSYSSSGSSLLMSSRSTQVSGVSLQTTLPLLTCKYCGRPHEATCPIEHLFGPRTTMCGKDVPSPITHSTTDARNLTICSLFASSIATVTNHVMPWLLHSCGIKSCSAILTSVLRCWFSLESHAIL